MKVVEGYRWEHHLTAIWQHLQAPIWCGASPTHGTLYAIDSKDSLDGEFANRFLYQVDAELLFIESSNESNVRS